MKAIAHPFDVTAQPAAQVLGVEIDSCPGGEATSRILAVEYAVGLINQLAEELQKMPAIQADEKATRSMRFIQNETGVLLHRMVGLS